MKIVMVDDCSADRKVMRRLLGEARGGLENGDGGEPVEFHEESGAAAGLRTCLGVTPDCVLIDYKLPDMTGLEFLARLRAEENGAGPVAAIMLTGLASERIAVDAMKAGAQDYLVKDRITGEGLRLAVGKAIEKAGLMRALKQERDRLAQSLAEKEVLIKEVHHRVKNNLQVISSLLRLQSGAVTDPVVAEALRRSQHRVESMAQIHEQLYQSGVGQVELARQAGMLLSNLFDAYGVDPARISGRVEMARQESGAPLVLGANEAIPVGLILNELISNALKHAFADGRAGWLAVTGRLEVGWVTLEVGDNGTGVPHGVDVQRPKSLGLQIVGILARQLKGTVELGAGSGGGTMFVVRFPEVRFPGRKA
jgi:two-component sensor histidine kinase/CheY-like chemotaxis protein